MIAAINNFFGTILSWFNQITGSYALALLLYALMFKLLFLPFGIKQQKTLIKQAQLRPKIAKIEKKYAGRYDNATRQKMQQEIMDLQQKEGVSPLGGCLPLLLQMPIIIILYNVIRQPLSYICKLGSDTIANIATAVGGNASDEISLISAVKGQIAAGTWTGVEGFDPSVLPNFHVFGVDLSANPSFTNFSILILIPILAAAAQWLSMFLMRKFQGNTQTATDAQAGMSMKIMDLMMPLLTLFLAFSFSGMLGLYWIYQSLLGILQSFILCKVMPLPKYTDEELKAMEKADKERAKAQKAALSEQPRYKSLHHIDDEDYDELPELNKPKPSDKKTSGIEGAALKDDKKNDDGKKN